jgi:hypothetical protein
MKKTLFAICIALSSLTVWGQAFEGKITYTLSYESKNANVSSQQWASMMGTTQEYIIKGGNYKSNSNGTLLQWQVYVNAENKLYTKMSNSQNALWNDAGIQGDEILKVEINKGVTEILGYKCDEIILTCKSGVQKYYFNSKIAVDPKLFTNHKFGNWSYYLAKSNALPLKMIIETSQFTMETIATAISPIKVDSKTLELPADIKTEKSPY